MARVTLSAELPAVKRTLTLFSFSNGASAFSRTSCQRLPNEATTTVCCASAAFENNKAPPSTAARPKLLIDFIFAFLPDRPCAIARTMRDHIPGCRRRKCRGDANQFFARRKREANTTARITFRARSSGPAAYASANGPRRERGRVASAGKQLIRRRGGFRAPRPVVISPAAEIRCRAASSGRNRTGCAFSETPCRPMAARSKW